MKKNIIFNLLFIFTFALSANDGVESVERDSAYFLNSKVTSNTAEPTALQYYEFKENLPNEISIDIYKNKDMSALEGKKIFVGYGSIDPTGEDCKVFTPDVTGQENNISVCLPWWRVEREYAIEKDTGVQGDDFRAFIATMQRPRPPKNVSVCNAWQSSAQLPSGKVTCTTYYDKTISDECFNNPIQAQCKKNNCGTWVEENCERSGRSIGYEVESLYNVEISSATPQTYESKVDLVTEQFVCPGGSFTNFANCIDEVTVAMHPYECKPDDPSTPLDDSIMKYCDENQPVRDITTGNIVGFVGTCPVEASNNGQAFEVTCRVDSFRQTRNVCTEQGATITNTTTDIIDQSYDLHYTVHDANVLSGAVDVYATREDCVRSNTIEESREDVTYIMAKGSGYLDDDIYLTVHHADDTHSVVYCNQQHNANQGSKLNFAEMGGVVQCIPNSGHYSFNQQVTINEGDIVSVQQASEFEDSGLNGFEGSFSARNHYISSKVVIDNIEATPSVYKEDFPYYPKYSETYLKLWDNTLGSLAIMFPYVGYYKLYFYNNDGELVAQQDIAGSDFDLLTNSISFKQLFLADQFETAPELNANNEDSLCLQDNFVDYGGGVYGNKGSKTGEYCQAQASGTYSKSKAIKRVIIKDMLTSTYTVIPLVYPLGYPNRVFISKLKLYENREYFCYEEPVISAPY
ncbi:hypothetical protein [Sulfurimonas sp.]|uniref:hypothetical protein n=1 Tax=Sulfurimonas sp. TaxID=2022749 RepID=UPI0025DE924E|nr:hypothetical protein [Sulfurimonas sp.]MBW6487541.1 hypothetical protein [Sulfurimonas sp.]